VNFEQWWLSIVEELERKMVCPSPFQMWLHKMIAGAAWNAALKSVENKRIGIVKRFFNLFSKQ
jgi:hypothetical protein